MLKKSQARLAQICGLCKEKVTDRQILSLNMCGDRYDVLIASVFCLLNFSNYAYYVRDAYWFMHNAIRHCDLSNRSVVFYILPAKVRKVGILHYCECD